MTALHDSTTTPLAANVARKYAVRGLQEDAAAALRSILHMLHGRTHRHWVQSEVGATDVLFQGADDDHSDHHDAAALATRVVSVQMYNSVHFGGAHRLDYPFRVFQVLSLLEQLETELTACREQGVRNMASVHRNDSWALYDSLQAHNIIAHEIAWLAAPFEDGRALFIRNDLKAFAADASVSADVAAGKLPQQMQAAGAAPDTTIPVGCGAQLLWRVGLHSGRGGLSSELDPRRPQRLTGWPDFGRTRPEPGQVRMSALLTNGAWSRDQLVAKMAGQIDANAVNRFLNACALSGLLHAESMPTLAVVPQAAATGFLNSLVSRIRNKLGFGQPTEISRS